MLWYSQSDNDAGSMESSAHLDGSKDTISLSWQMHRSALAAALKNWILTWEELGPKDDLFHVVFVGFHVQLGIS